MVSVFLVTYNQEKYIRQALDSILMQEVDFDYEIIIGEDCSTDSTATICDEYASKYPFIHVYHHNPNKGLVKNWEFVLNHCKGEYVAMLEGDDLWLDANKLKLQYEWLEQNKDMALVFTGVKTIYENPQSVDEHLFCNLETRAYTKEEILQNWIILTSSVMFRNNVKTVLKYPQDVFMTDTYTFLKIMSRGGAYCISDPMTGYRRHGANITGINQIYEKMFRLYWNFAKQYAYMSKEYAEPSLSAICKSLSIQNCNYILYHTNSCLKDRFKCISLKYRLDSKETIKGWLSSVYTYVIKPYLHLK